jgi:hypothetical protein
MILIMPINDNTHNASSPLWIILQNKKTIVQKNALMLTKNLRLFIAGITLFLAACQSNPQSTTTTTDQSGFHKIVVKEVLQASEYTYLNAKENNNDIWLAVPAMQAKAGDTYYYEGGVEMKKFESKELKKVFESIILLEKLNTEPKSSSIVASNKPYANPTPAADNQATSAPATATQDGSATSESYTRKAPPIEKKEIKIAPASGGITIGKLFSQKEAFGGKTVKVKGQVTKYTPLVMGKNWIHIQDGTDFGGKFDLTITSESEVKVGDVVTFEGKVGLNKDFGYGYTYDVIVEEAVKK